MDEPASKKARMEAPSLLPPRINHTGRLSEADVGITEYINGTDTTSFHGIVKHRFTDFLVYEVGLDAERVRLKDIKNPDQDVVIERKAWPEDATTIFAGLLSLAKLNELQQFVTRGPPSVPIKGKKKADSKPQVTPSVNGGVSLYTTDSMESKETRSRFHRVIRETFKGRLASEHREADTGDGVIDVQWSTSGRGQSRRQDPRQSDGHPPFIRFSLQKSNRDTQDAMSLLSKALKCHPSKDLSFCGTKDKRSVSVQKVTLKRNRRTLGDVWTAVQKALPGGQPSTDQASANGKPSMRGSKGIRIGDLEYCDTSLGLGQLEGNHFIITLRDINPPLPDQLSQSLQTLKIEGFLNYYGMQRFGSSAIGTHMVGVALFRSDWALATDFILRPRAVGTEFEEVAKARQVWYDERDAKKALELLPRRMVAERSVLEHYSKNGNNDHSGAFSRIPRALRLMYVHAYQSYLWNHAVSERVKRFGTSTVVPGDLVQLNDHVVDDDDPMLLDGSQDAQQSVTIVEEGEEYKYSIYDVVLPLPGSCTVWPKNGIECVIQNMMEADGLDWKSMFHAKSEYCMKGTYRKIVHRPTHVDWRFLTYIDPNQALARADEDVLLDIPLNADATLTNSTLPIESPSTKPVVTGTESEEAMALQIEWTLGRSVYATMAIRQVTRVESGSDQMTELSRKMQDKFTKQS